MEQKYAIGADVLDITMLNVCSRHVLSSDKWTAWLHLVYRLMKLFFFTYQMSFKEFHVSRVFLVKSMSLDLQDDNTEYLIKYMWKLKVSLKIRIFYMVPPYKRDF
jgi:hypothetical protein